MTDSYHRNRKLQRVLLNLRLKIKDKAPLEQIEVPNAPRLLTDGKIIGSLTYQWRGALPPKVNKGSKDKLLYIAVVIGLISSLTIISLYL